MENEVLSKTRIKSFDGLKGIVACMIAFCWHYQHFDLSRDNTPTICGVLFPYSFNKGFLCVEVFFFISGITMMMAYSDKVRSREIQFSAFIRKRLSKIYPYHLITLLFVALFQYIYRYLMGAFFVNNNITLKDFILNITMLQVFFTNEVSYNLPAWFISVLIPLHIIFFIIIQTSDSQIKILVKSVVIWAAGIVIYGLLPWSISLQRGIVTFFSGVILYSVYNEFKNKRINTDLYGILAFLLFAAYYATIVLNLTPIPYLRFIVSLVATPSIVIASVFFKPLSKLLSARCLVKLGELSMIIYFVHYPIQLLISTITAYFELKIDYKSFAVWLAYVLIVLILSFTIQKTSKNYLDSRKDNKITINL
ncbi:MAG: acyltransferase [Clostridiales bacterium]|nr:acyltransferase [Clostridiales bacterium]